MARNTNDNFKRLAPKPLDDSQGLWSSGAWRPFNSVSEAYEAIKDYAYLSLTVPIIVDGEQRDYWFVGGLSESNLVVKSGSADLSNYYTKTELQTSGSAQVHWDNLTNVPDIQSPLTFQNGLREEDGVVKLGSGPFDDLGNITESVALRRGPRLGTHIAIEFNGGNALAIRKQIDDTNTLQGLFFSSSGGGNLISVADDVNHKGLQEIDDYSA